MKKLVVTDKGIGIAKMPEKPYPYQGDDQYFGSRMDEYESAVKQAIASAPLFEDQERVKEWISLHSDMMHLWNPDMTLKHGTYPIPPGFPEYVEVEQVKQIDGSWADNGPRGSLSETRTIIRFADKHKRMIREYFNDIANGRDLDKQESTNYMAVIPQTREEKIAMYMKLPKEEVCGMLAECNRIVESMSPKVVVVDKQEQRNHLRAKVDSLQAENERLNKVVKTYSDMSLRCQSQLLEKDKEISNWKTLSELNSEESIRKGLMVNALQSENEELKQALVTRDGDLTSKILKAENDRLKEETQTWKTRFETEDAENDRLRKEHQATQSKLDRVKEYCEERKMAIGEIKTKEILDLLK